MPYSPKEAKSQKQLRENILYLFLLQCANYILPLITMPYLVRILGAEKFGLIAFAQAFMQYFVILTDYGFNLSASRQIAIYRQDVAKVSTIFVSTMVAKIILMLISLFIVSVTVLTIPQFRRYSILYFLVFMGVLGNVLFPVWFFQGMERMKFTSFINIAVKSISVAALFVFVQNESDYLIAASLQAGGTIFAGLLGLSLVRRVAAISYHTPSLHQIQTVLSDGWQIFVSTASISLYTNSTLFILGLIVGNQSVGYYSAARKLVAAVEGLLSPISQAIFPRVNALASQCQESALAFIRVSLKWVGSGAFVLSCMLFIGAKQIVLTLFGMEFQPVIVLVRLMAFLPFIIALSNIFGIQTMLAFDLKSQFTKILILSGILNILLAPPLILHYDSMGAAIATLLIEVIVTSSMGFVLFQKRLGIVLLKK